ncbi:hypothetical protein [Agromyces sp. Leaf222]|uniref:hypothetical protein n=1 Tax=Agromyces sp. Leaf222 TaxID=1735688 RepID=UPI0006FAC878|nr:hypothetical protein [Agromyces sp. Leaf222]KQM83674.1 hypothetical protein ASE68_11015 [Agromyces sp. Leaf222]
MTRLPRILSAAAVVTVAAALLAGCSGPGGAASDAPTIDVLVRDSNLRVEGEACSGARPNEYIHRGAEVVLEHESDRIVVELPDGEAVRMDDIDYGAAPRIPTACRFRIAASGLAPDLDYTVTIDGRDAGSYRYTPADAAPIAVPPLADPGAILETGDH